GAQAEAPRPGAQCRGGLNAGELICGHEPPVEGFGDPGRRRAQIIDPALRQFLGRDALDVNFDQGGWMGILGVGAGVDVLVADGREPLMVMFTDGASGGRVAYTTFHNEAQATADVQQILTALLFQL
ncbi:MAG: hypothetical protein R3F43_29180, partial [bacterium]